ncbi:hypothetical protein [Natrialba asiatica]|uniref:DUF8129 domain-containing protein n=1 Tax=Natrialba asiatica (strain ATCC 700177 / DSM 12278 / JCM 9576 / FERM P-10747 / NBRC 102637 / 172P1) TaxID=29540 RepID=M0AED3_NATA1|nr:hypothetical protein [Natrialba asiatica]ELY97095.1 hypothetical protein C481_20931 [Natrialba asiatica DSM 12278]
MNGRYAAATDVRHEFSKIETTHGEDPARFLQANKELVFARIAGIRDLELLEAWRAVERQITDGGRPEVLDALDERKAELTSENLESPRTAARNRGAA